MAGRRRSILALCLLTSCIVPTFSAIGSETVTYSYDERGRLIQVGRSGTVNDGISANYSYDKADNRTNVTVSGPSFSVNDVSVTEGGSLVFTVTKSGATSNSLSVSYATSNGTATAGSDYTAKSGTLTFLSSDTAKTVSVTTSDDATAESAETVNITLSNPTGGASLSDATGIGTINDNDSLTCGGVSFTIASNAAVTEGANSVFTVTKAGTTSNSCSVNYATANGTATAGSDYTAASGTLTFTSAQTSKTVSVTTTNDTTVESAETFTMSLSSPTGGSTVGSPGSATATVNDNDGNQAPTPVNDTGSQEKCTTAVYYVTGNDTDPDGDYPLTVTAVSGIGFSVYSSSEVQFTSTQGTGAKVGTYTVQDSLGATANATLTVTVSGGICGLSAPETEAGGSL
jgi:hypothetical protein